MERGTSQADREPALPGDEAPVEPEAADPPLALEETIGRDLASASYYELLAWARELGLPETGNRDQLERRLRQELALAPEPAPAPADRSIQIVSADRTEFERTGSGDLIRLYGSVELRLEDSRDGSEHVVRADRLYLDSARDLLTASGAVVYQFRQADRSESFVGETLSFDISDWSGWFLDGQSLREQSIDGTRVEFRFAGERISRSGGNTIVLDDAVITSSRLVPPAYSIDADRIWVTAPGEWGLRSAVLRVGRVPVAAIPFFFRPGDRLFVNPALGTRETEGTYLQTTTYLRGQPERGESPFAILQVAEDETENRLVRDGLFLVPDQTADSQAASSDPPGTLRLIADIYSRGGAAAGIAVDGIRGGPVRNLELTAIVAVSPVIWSLSGLPAAATVDLAGNLIREYDRGQFLGFRVPVRYAADFSTDVRLGDVIIGIELPLFSDPEFPRDFQSRSEQTNWLELLGLSNAPVSVLASPRSSLGWELELSPLTLADEVPLVGGRLQLERSRTRLDWRSDTAANPISPPAGTGPTSVLRTSSDSYYRPDRYTLLDTGLNWSSRFTLFRRSGETAAAAGDSLLRPPWADSGEAAESTVDPNVSFALPPPLLPLEPASTGQQEWSGRVQTNLNVSLDLGGPFASEDWAGISDISWQVSYQGLDVLLRPQLSLDIESPQERVGLGLRTTYADRRILVDTFGNPLLEGSAAQRELEQAVQLNRASLNQELSLDLVPLPGIPIFRTFRIDYDAAADLLRRSVTPGPDADPGLALSSSTWETIVPDDSWISRHRVLWSLGESGAVVRSLTASVDLPPRNAGVSAGLSLAAGDLLETQLGWSASRSEALGQPDDPGAEDNWQQQPLSVGAELSPFDWLSGSGQMRFQLDESTLAGYSLGLGIGELDTELSATRSLGFRFGGPGVGWEQDVTESLELRRFSLSWNDRWEPEPIWKNRIRLTADAGISVRQNLDQVTDSLLSLTAGLRVSVHEVLTFRLSSTSVNRFLYRYVDAFSSQLGLERRPVLPDLVDSIALWSRERRVQSFFNLQALQTSAQIRLDSWVVEVDYRGAPELQTEEAGQQSYRWSGALALTVQWDPIPELREELDILPSDDGFILELGADGP